MSCIKQNQEFIKCIKQASMKKQNSKLNYQIFNLYLCLNDLVL